jgi:hypothetical protein
VCNFVRLAAKFNFDLKKNSPVVKPFSVVINTVF